jgi:hypothetical protein
MRSSPNRGGLSILDASPVPEREFPERPFHWLLKWLWAKVWRNSQRRRNVAMRKSTLLVAYFSSLFSGLFSHFRFECCWFIRNQSRQEGRKERMKEREREKYERSGWVEYLSRRGGGGMTLWKFAALAVRGEFNEGGCAGRLAQRCVCHRSIFLDL